MEKRLKWVREKLGLSINEAHELCEVPRYFYVRREYGMGTPDYENMAKIAKGFNNLWQERFLMNNNFPKYNDERVELITLNWILFGKDETIEELNKIGNVLSANILELKGYNLGE